MDQSYLQQIINKMLHPTQLQKCQLHSLQYQLIGQDKQCELNCQICCGCLKTISNPHKSEGINHKTISIIELKSQFQKIREYSKEEIKKCGQMLEGYLKKYMDLMIGEMNREKIRLMRAIENIAITQISKEEEQLKILQLLLHQQYDGLICKQVGKISKKLFTFVPKEISAGFKRFYQYMQEKDGKLQAKLKQFLQDRHYDEIVLRDIYVGIKYPNFDQPQPIPQPEPEMLPQPISPKRSITEPTSPVSKHTPRRSIRKKPSKQKISSMSPQKSLLDIKDFHVKIRKPLEFKDSTIIKSKEETTFVQKLFNRKIFDAKMLYRASDNDFSVIRFHQYCDGEPNTIVFVKTEFNKVIGGFTPIPWRSTKNTIHSDIRKQSFLFSVTLKQKMQLLDQKAAVFNSLNFGPTFGNGADLSICHNANIEKTSYAQFPYSYGNCRYTQNNQHSTFLFTGQQQGNHFLIRQWQVWKLDFNE